MKRILDMSQWFRRRLFFKIYSIFSTGGQYSGTICALLVEGIMRNISVKLFWIWTSGSQKEMLFKDIPIFCSGGHFLTDQNSLCNFERQKFLSNYLSPLQKSEGYTRFGLSVILYVCHNFVLAQYLVNISMHIPKLVKFYQFVLEILSEK